MTEIRSQEAPEVTTSWRYTNMLIIIIINNVAYRAYL